MTFQSQGATLVKPVDPLVVAANQSQPIQGGDVPGTPVDTKPVHGGGKGKNTEPAPVPNDAAVSTLFDTRGRQVIIADAVPENWEHGYTITNITNTTPRDLLPRPGAGLKTYLCDVDISNMSGSVATVVQIIDEDGSVLYQIGCTSGGGGVSKGLKIPRPGGVNKKIQAKCLTPGADVCVDIGAYRGS